MFAILVASSSSRLFEGSPGAPGWIIGTSKLYSFEKRILFEKAKTRLNYVFNETIYGDLRSIPKHSISGLIDIPITVKTYLSLIGQFTGNRIANDYTELDLSLIHI